MQQQPADVDAVRAAWLVHANDAAAAANWQAARVKGDEQRPLDVPVTPAEQQAWGLGDASSYSVHPKLPHAREEVAVACSMLAPHNTEPNGDTLQRQRRGTASYDVDGFTSVKVWGAVPGTPWKLARIAGTCTVHQQGSQPAATYRVYRVLVWRPDLTPEQQEQQQAQQAQVEAWQACRQRKDKLKCEPPMWWWPHSAHVDGAAGYVGGIALYAFTRDELESEAAAAPAAPVDAAAAAAAAAGAGEMEGVEEEEQQQQQTALAAALQQQLSLAECSSAMRRLHARSRLLKLQLLALGAGYCGGSSASLFSALLPCVAAHNADVIDAAGARGVQGAEQLVVDVLRVTDRLGRSLLHLLATASLPRAAPERAVAEAQGRRLNRVVLFDDAALAAAGMAGASSFADVARRVRTAAAADAQGSAAGGPAAATSVAGSSSFDAGTVQLELLRALKQHTLAAAADGDEWRRALGAFNSGGATAFHTASHFCEPGVLGWFVREMSEQGMLLVLTRNGRAFWHVICRQAKALQDSGGSAQGLTQLLAEGLRVALEGLADALARPYLCVAQDGAAGSPGSSGLSSGTQQLISLDAVAAGPRPAKQPRRGRNADRWPAAVLEHLSQHVLFHHRPCTYDAGMLCAAVQELFGLEFERCVGAAG